MKWEKDKNGPSWFSLIFLISMRKLTGVIKLNNALEGLVT